MAFIKSIKIGDVETAQFWDASSQTQYESLTSLGKFIAFQVAYDITSQDSFDRVDSIVSDIRKVWGPNVSMYILGCN